MNPTRILILALMGAVGALTVRMYQLRCKVRDLAGAHNFVRDAYQAHQSDDERHVGVTFLRRKAT